VLNDNHTAGPILFCKQDCLGEPQKVSSPWIRIWNTTHRTVGAKATYKCASTHYMFNNDTNTSISDSQAFLTVQCLFNATTGCKQETAISQHICINLNKLTGKYELWKTIIISNL
jgi:hypothetical protein